MKNKISQLILITTCVCLFAHASVVLAQEATLVPVEPSELMLGRGPIHAAFAEVITFNPTPGMIAPRIPPDPIQELPPELRPAGTRVQWIPGYWTWDDERNDFIWVSGGWRNAPPNRRWIPGYWTKVSNGYQWISGFWTQDSAGDIEYLPLPPVSVEEGATGAPPSADHFWVPGCWVWRNATYLWRPGFWSPASPGWIWIPAHYRYTPRGIVYVDGYWDHDLTRRGNLYAPVYYSRPIYAQTGYYYRPTSLVELGLLTASLFVQPEHQHYYYGDYYAPRHRDRGYYPWYGYSSAQRGFDPLFSYYAWQHRSRNDNDWRAGLEREYQQRRDQPGLRPPHIIEKGIRQQTARPLVRTPDDLPTDRGSERLERPTDQTREWIEQMRQLRRDRKAAEQTDSRSGRPPTAVTPTEPNQAPLTQEPSKRIRQGASPTDSTPRADVPRWKIPEIPDRVQQGSPRGKARPEKLQAPARPEPLKQPAPGPKPESVLSRKKSKGNK